MRKLILLSRKRLTVIACGLCAILMLAVVNVPAYLPAAATARQLPIYCVDRDQKMVSISFDAAWGDVIAATVNYRWSMRPPAVVVYSEQMIQNPAM